MASSSILYQNAEQTITLIDVPASIAHAQEPSSTCAERCPLSFKPLETPYPITNEPSKDKNIQGNTVDGAYHDHIRGLIEDAIREIKTTHHGDWCGPRQWKQTSKASNSEECKAGTEVDKLTEKDASDSRTSTQNHLGKEDRADCYEFSKPCITTQSLTVLDKTSRIYNCPFRNTSNETIHLSLPSSNNHSSQRFLIPGHSQFIQSRIQDSIFTFRMAAMEHLSSTTASAGPGQFDFILLDPPWPNASAKRARSYDRLRTAQETEELLLSVGFEDHIAPGGYVGIWITNKQMIRKLVLGKSVKREPSDEDDGLMNRGMGLFDQWELDLVEEWIWIKTTVHGEPVTDLESAWRKPYEILLLGRRRSSSHHPSEEKRPTETKRRVIAGVPDLHSRKPCLKELIECLMPDATQYRALEVFARHLTAGWWAWGDEVLKFNWEGTWVEKDSVQGLQSSETVNDE